MAKPYLIERIVSSLSYLTMGFVGLIYIIIGVFTQAKLRQFSQYHIFQSIFLSIAYFLLSTLCGFLLNLFSYIPFINKIVAQITFYLNTPLLGPYSLIQTVLYGFVIYLVISSFMGFYSRIPYISNIIDQNINRY